jgi:MarR-like DNA-binding transcriptional regulator SgrR of sgrS sRNA
MYSQHGSKETIEITLEELAASLECTHRNAMILVSNMVNHGWISWTPRRGRGRRSLLQFLVQPDEIAVQSMMQAINRTDITRVFNEIRTHARSTTIHEHVQGWLLSYFGHHSEIRKDKQIDTLRIPIRQQLHTIDPLYTNLLVESFVASHLFDGLVRRSSETHEILPHLAHAWEVDSSRKQWTFFLRKEVLFHTGRVMTAEDVVYTLERLVQTSRRTLYSFIFKQIKSVRAVHSNLVTIELKEPNELFLPFLCTSRAAIVPRDLEQLGDIKFGTNPIGTGPFKIAELNQNICSLEVFTPYFKGRAHLDRVEIVHVPLDMQHDSSEPLAPFHVIHNPPSSEGEAWSQIHSKTSVMKFLTCNTKKQGLLNDPVVRARILACILDDKEPTSEIASGNENENENENEHDHDDPLTLQISTIPQYKQDADLVAQKLIHSGYSCMVKSTPLEEFKGPVRLESDLILFSLLRDQDEQLRLFDLYLTIAEHVQAHVRVDIENTLRAITQQSDSLARAALFARIEGQLIREHQLCILHEKPVQTAYLPSVRGVTFNSQGWVDLRNIWFPFREKEQR